MTRRGDTLLLALVAGLVALPAQASDPAGGIGDLVKTGANLILLLGVIAYFARKPIAQYFAQRRSGIEGALTSAAEGLHEAEATYAKWQRRLVDLEAELEEIRATSRHRAESERERILDDARKTAERIRRDATAAVDQELRRARETLREEATQLAIEIATERLESEVNEGDRDRLLDEFIERMNGDTSAGAREGS